MKKAFFLCALFCFNTAKSSKFGEDAHIRFLNQLSKENEEYLKKCRQDAEERLEAEAEKLRKEKSAAQSEMIKKTLEESQKQSEESKKQSEMVKKILEERQAKRKAGEKESN